VISGVAGQEGGVEKAEPKINVGAEEEGLASGGANGLGQKGRPAEGCAGGVGGNEHWGKKLLSEIRGLSEGRICAGYFAPVAGGVHFLCDGRVF